MGDLGPHLIRGSLGPHESPSQTASQSVQPFLQGSLVWQTDRPRDHATRSVTVGCIYIRSTAMRPKKSATRSPTCTSTFFVGDQVEDQVWDKLLSKTWSATWSPTSSI